MGWLSDLFSNESSQQLQGWDPAMGGLNAAMDIGEQSLQNPWEVYGGDTHAGMNQMQQQGMQGMAGYGGGMGGAIAGQLAGQGSQAYSGALGGYANTMQGMQGGGPQVGQLDFGYAGQVADNPYMDSMISGALRDPYRMLTEQTMPGIDAGAAMSGQSSGSERYQNSQIAERGFADRASDVGAAMRGGAYGQGLGIAQQQATMNPALQMQGYGLQNQAAGGLANMGQYGLGQGYNMGQQNIGMQMDAGNFLQGQQQAQMNDQMNQYYLGQQMPMMQAQQGIDMFQPLAQNFGTNTQTQSTGLGNAAMQIGGQIGGAMMMGGFNPFGGGGGGQQMQPMSSGYGGSPWNAGGGMSAWGQMPTAQQQFPIQGYGG